MRGIVGGLAVVMLLTGVLTCAPAAGAQQMGSSVEPPPSGETRIPSEAILAAVRLGETTERLMRIEADLVDVQRREDALRAELGILNQQLSEHRAKEAEIIARVRERAATVYARGGSGPLAPLSIDSRQDLKSGQTYTAAVNSVDRELIEELVSVREALERDRQRKADALADLERVRVSLEQSRAEVEVLRVQEQLLVDEWGLVTVMGRSQLTAAQIAAWYESTGIEPRLPAALTIADLAWLFVEEGDLAGVRGDVAFAQSIIETGSFTEFKGYNFSGIGVCDSCTGGYLFDAAREGVRAQAQLLRSYADPTSRAADLPVPLSPVLYGTDPVEGARRFDTFFKKGAAPVWNEMGGGNWATDPNYADKVLRVYARMLAHAEGG